MNDIDASMVRVEALIPAPLMKLVDEFILQTGQDIMKMADEGLPMFENMEVEQFMMGLLITRGLTQHFGPECSCDRCTSTWLAEYLGFDFDEEDDD